MTPKAATSITCFTEEERPMHQQAKTTAKPDDSAVLAAFGEIMAMLAELLERQRRTQRN